MASKLVPSSPSDVTVIRKVTENIVTLSAPFARFGHIKVGGRGTLVRLQSGAVAVFSPTALTPAVKETVSALGEVKYITAPDLEHHIYIGDWHKAYPNAKVIAPEGLAEKRKKQDVHQVPIHVTFTAKEKQSISVDPDFDANFDYELVDAHVNKELVFNYKPDRTLIEADLFFNLPATEQYSKSGEAADSGILTKFWSTFNNTRGEAIAQRRFIWYLISAKDRSGFNRSVARIASWSFDRVIPCHGDVIETGAKGIFEKVMQWHLAAAKNDKKSD